LVPPFIASFGVFLASRVFDLGGGLGLAALMGAFILLLDFVLVATLGGGSGGKRRWVLVTYRSLVALGIGWFIARPAILLTYGQAIDGLNRKSRWEEIRKTTEERDALRQNSNAAHQPLAQHYAARQKLLEDELRTVIASKAPVVERIAQLDREHQDEDLKGLDGRKPGPGHYWETRGKYLKEENAKLEKIEAEQKRIETELAAVATSSEEQFVKANDDPAIKTLDEAASKQINEVKDSVAGWADREDLMMKWVFADPMKRLPGFIIIHGVLLLLDLLPLLTMLFVPRSELDMIRRIHEARLSAEVESAEKVAKEGVEETMQERLTRDRLRESTATLQEISDLRFNYAGHQTLRYLQAVSSLRPVFFKLRFATTKPSPEQEDAWVEASKPLRRAMERNLQDFDNLVG
jgi:hypothetical protein